MAKPRSDSDAGLALRAPKQKVTPREFIDKAAAEAAQRAEEKKREQHDNGLGILLRVTPH